MRDAYVQYRKKLIERQGAARHDLRITSIAREDRKMSRIQVMFDPKTIALIGATEKEGAIGRTILENLLRSKERRIFPVNPHAR